MLSEGFRLFCSGSFCPEFSEKSDSEITEVIAEASTASMICKQKDKIDANMWQGMATWEHGALNSAKFPLFHVCFDHKPL